MFWYKLQLVTSQMETTENEVVAQEGGEEDAIDIFARNINTTNDLLEIIRSAKTRTPESTWPPRVQHLVMDSAQKEIPFP